MLATIIKSPKAVQTTLDIIETYARIRDLSRSMSRLPVADKAELERRLKNPSKKISHAEANGWKISEAK